MRYSCQYRCAAAAATPGCADAVGIAAAAGSPSRRCTLACLPLPMGAPLNLRPHAGHAVQCPDQVLRLC